MDTWVFDMPQYFEKILHLVEGLWFALQDEVYIPGLTNRWQSIIGNPIDQQITIDDNQLIAIDCYRPIDDQSIITSSSPLIAIDCHRLQSITIDH